MIGHNRALNPNGKSRFIMSMPQINNILKEAIALHLKNRFQEAMNSYSLVLSIDATNSDASYLLGLLLLQTGHTIKGEEFLKRASALNSQNQDSSHIFKDLANAKAQREIEAIPVEKEYPIFPSETVGGWRMLRMLDFINCLQSNDSQNWLTIGDAYGHDAKILKSLGVNNVVASNLDASFLRWGNKVGEVSDYLEINAESIDLPSNSIDYVLCKEALHHMPRAYLAIYEMLRVAKKGVLFIEPQDQLIDWPCKKSDYYREIIPDNLVGEKISFRNLNNNQEIINSSIDWWEDGAFNYVFTLSQREVRKIALGMGLPSFATKCFNDFYNAEWNTETATIESPGFAKTKEQILLHDKVCEITGKPHSYITGLLFKQTPDPSVIEKLIALNYTFTYTPSRFIPIKWPNLA